MAWTEAQLSLLHDHYKETFALIRDRERQRDRLFFWLFVLYAVLIIEIQYPANAHGVLGAIEVAGVRIDLAVAPLSLLLNASWVFVAGSVLKYCQVTMAVERQYDYLHTLEKQVGAAFGESALYAREGRAYLDRYPRLLTWAWVAYTFIFPLVLLAGTLYLYGTEAGSLPYPWVSKSFDGLLMLSILVSICLYRFFPGHREKSAGKTATYLDEVAARIRRELNEKPSDSTPQGLMHLYAVLLLAKGERVAPQDVHNAWAAWTVRHTPEHPDIRPFDELETATRDADRPFTEAIRRAARDPA